MTRRNTVNIIESVKICFKQYFRISKSVYQPFVQGLKISLSMNNIIQQKISNRPCSSNWNVSRSRWNLTECIRGENAQHSSVNDPPRKPA